MERMELKVFKRAAGKTVSRKLRKEGNVPAVLYGAKRESQPLFVDVKEIEKVISTEAGWNILLDLDLEGKEKILSRITDYQADVLSRDLTHIDFQVLDLKKKIKTEVPLHLTGKAKGVKEGGILEVSRREIEVRCLPTQIPEHIDIDVSNLDIGDNIHISDVTLPEGVEIVEETNFSIAAIVAPTEELTAELPTEEGVAVEGEAPAEGAEGAAPAEGEAPAEGAEPAASKKEGKKKE